MSWVFRFRRDDGQTFAIERMNPNVSDLLFLLAGIKPVLYTHVLPADADWMRDLAKFFGLQVVFNDRGARDAGNPLELFLGADAAALESAIRLGRIAGRREEDARWGALLGYPACCVKAFARKRCGGANRDFVPLSRSNTRGSAPIPFLLNNVFNFSTRLDGSERDARLSRRLSHSNRAEDGPSLYMLHVLPWHPCSYRCRASAARGERAWQFMARMLPEFAQHLRETTSRPVLYFNKWEFVLLEGEAASWRECRYSGIARPVSLVRAGWRNLIGAGDSLFLKDGEVVVRKRGRRIGTIRSPDALLLPFQTPVSPRG